MAFLWDISHAVHERRLIPGFLTGAFYNFLFLSFQRKVNIKRKILELLSACGKMKKEKAQLSRLWQNNQWIKHGFCVWQAPTSLGLQSGLLWDTHKNIQVIISLLLQSKSFTSESLLQMNSHRCRVPAAVSRIPMPAIAMPYPGHGQASSVRKAKAWAALAKATAFLGCQQREEAIPQLEKLGDLSSTWSSPSFCWGLPVQGNIPTPARGGLAGVCILSDRQTDLIHPQSTKIFV